MKHIIGDRYVLVMKAMEKDMKRPGYLFILRDRELGTYYERLYYNKEDQTRELIECFHLLKNDEENINVYLRKNDTYMDVKFVVDLGIIRYERLYELTGFN